MANAIGDRSNEHHPLNEPEIRPLCKAELDVVSGGMFGFEAVLLHAAIGAAIGVVVKRDGVIFT